ncbi:polysaccharide deacetylase family protein [Patulibacter defluvii]|uniref:polysaccharide deacetylase family protein n=1 Tax=Patulibacter defluvii TaxID=3095358 RepID=UPI002A75F821|nr:polysaccharide deacetylase family protein [Patulibacter sp. DM4]
MRAVPLLAGTSVAAGVGWALPALAPLLPRVAGALGLPRRLDLPGAVAVTFDDGPHPRGTPAVLEALREQGATATFFCVGEQVRRTGSLLAEVVAAGHAVAIHGDRHRLLLRRSPGAVRDDLDRAAETIGAVAGDALLPVHRAPYGIYAHPAIADLRRRGWRPLLWSRWGHDWRGDATAASIAAEVSRDLTAGDVLLLHDADDYSDPGSWRATAAALPRVLERIAAAGLVTAPVPAAG